MGSPLGVLFADSYMAYIEAKALASLDERPHIYCRYLDDVFVDVKDESALLDLKTSLEHNSVLKFTTELGVSNKLSFLDVSVSAPSQQFSTSVYRKATNTGHCLDGRSECPERYKLGVIRAYIYRAIKHSSTWQLVHQELHRIRQILANNSHSQRVIDSEIERILTQYSAHQRIGKPQGGDSDKHRLRIFYENQMNDSYKTDERILKKIIHNNIEPVQDGDKLELTIFYRSPKVSSLLMKNNLSLDRNPLKQTNVVYQFNCTHGDCARQHVGTYIGHTTTTLGRRLTMHLQEGGIKRHLSQSHDSALTREDLVTNTKIIDRCSDRRKLHVLEAVYIRDYDPSINRQVNARGTLSVFEGAPLGARL